MPQEPINKDSARLMKMSAKLRKASRIVMIGLTAIVILAGLFYLIQDPLTGIILLACGAMGAGGIVALMNRDNIM
ncbi:MAG: hypothetical protein AAF810_12975 [Cyanobacteria bacterium P01_D01_bin.36]